MRKFKVWIRDIKEFANQDMVKAQVFVDCDGVPIWRDKKAKLHSVSKMVDIIYSTGLKDKNDVEIYWGDIVKEDEYTKQLYLVKSGVFDNGQSYSDNESGNGFYLHNKVYGVESMHGDIEYEVIGNIYENKELLC